MTTYTFTGTATADTAEQAEALAKQQAEEEALLSQGAFVTQTSYNEINVRLNNDGTYTVSFTLKVTDDAPVDGAADTVAQASPGASEAPPNAVPSNAEANQNTDPATTSGPPKIQSTTNNAIVSTSSIPGAVALTTSALSPGNQNEPETSYIYRAIEVLSIFSKGQFIQEIQGAQIFFDVPETPNQSDNTREESATAGTATQADVRRVDNSLAANAASNTESSVETRRAPQPGEENQDPAGTGDAAAIMNAAATAPATSNGQVVGTNQTNTAGGTAQQTVSVPITLKNGTTTTVSTVEQVNALFTAGQIDFRTASGATVALQSLTSSQNKNYSVTGQQLMSMER